jgi:sugar/nucleoside kinase (ribokinase family)
MPGLEAQRPEPGRQSEAGPPDLVLIGHVGWATNRTASGTKASLGGSGYAAAFAAAVVVGDRALVGLVAQVGQDLDLQGLRHLGLNLDGLAVLPGASAKFYITDNTDGTRSFRSELGVAATPRFDTFPNSYFHAAHAHLGTMPPGQQLAWLGFLRDNGFQAPISADAFEYFVTTEPNASREVCDLADLIFINEAEYKGLYHENEIPKPPMVLKHGPRGADFTSDGMKHFASAIPAVDMVDGTGAGEILAGVYLALRTCGLPEDQALRQAARAATRSVTEFGVDGLHLTHELTAIRNTVHSKGHSE